MFGIGWPEMVIVLVVALIFIGPKKLPDLAKSLGRALAEFKKATNDFRESITMDSTLNEVKDEFKDLGKKVKDPLSKGSAADKKTPDSETSIDNEPASAPGDTTEADKTTDAGSSATTDEKTPGTDIPPESKSKAKTDGGDAAEIEKTKDSGSLAADDGTETASIDVKRDEPVVSVESPETAETSSDSTSPDIATPPEGQTKDA